MQCNFRKLVYFWFEKWNKGCFGKLANYISYHNVKKMPAKFQIIVTQNRVKLGQLSYMIYNAQYSM